MTEPSAFARSQEAIAAKIPRISQRLRAQHRWNYEEALLWVGLRNLDLMARALAWWAAYTDFYPDLFKDRSADAIARIVSDYLQGQPSREEDRPDHLLHGGGATPAQMASQLFDPDELMRRFPATATDWRVRPGERPSEWAVRSEPIAEAQRRLAGGLAGKKKTINGVLFAMAKECGASFKQDTISKVRVGLG